jgi:serine/threonine-protein kinase HipA
MALHLVSEHLDKTKAHRAEKKGSLVQLMRGVYVDADGDADATVLKHAVRIAKYLYPHAYLSAASAVLLGPTSEGKLFLSARRKQRTRIRALEIIQNEAPDHPSVANAVIDDGMGEIHVNVSTIRQRFLEAFRSRSEHAASIDEEMRAAIATRLVDEHKTPRAAAEAVWALARENKWYREGELAERYLLHPPSAAPVKNEAALDFLVAWHGIPIGELRHDGFEWRWRRRDHPGPALVRETTPGILPPFITALLPEGWLESVIPGADERATLKSGKRYMSNIVIVENGQDISGIPEDRLLTDLQRYTQDAVFTGNYEGPGRGDIEANFEKNLAQIFASADTPRLSGIQIKAPMYLDRNGTLSPSTGKPFTHILKPAGTGGYDALPIVEWTALTLGKAVGFEAPRIALVEMPDEMPPALLVERFDIRVGPKDMRLLALEDFCSVLDLPTRAKYDGTMERVGKAVRAVSTAPGEDLANVVRRALFAWLIADGDMHLKNLALLKIAAQGDNNFQSVRMAPLYDAVTTRVFPNLKHDRMALKLNGKDENLRRADFRTLATTIGLTAAEADGLMDTLLSSIRAAITRVPAPRPIMAKENAKQKFDEILSICSSRVQNFA